MKIQQQEQKYFQIWVSWRPDEPAYTCDDKDEALTVFAGAKAVMMNEREHIEVRTKYGNVIAAYPVEEGEKHASQ